MSKDPILFEGGQANLYVYVANDPINRRDPTGLWYLDFNATPVLAIFGGTGGVFVHPGGIDPYLGGGLATPGGGASACFGTGSPSPGMLSGQVTFSFMFGSIGPVIAYGRDATGASFWEFGVGIGPPGPSLSGTGYYTW